MSEILFIADDPCILALIENLQPLVEPGIGLESDYTSGIKRIFDTHPAVVFLQHRIGDVACDKLANQVKMLLDGEAVPLVLLSDQEVMSYSVVSTYEACFDLCLPLGELSLQVQQLLHTLPKIAWKESAPLAARTSGEEPSETMEITLPGGAADFFMPFDRHGDNAGSAGESAPSPFDGGILEALEGDSLAIVQLTNALELGEPLFLPDFLADRSAIEPFPLTSEEAPLQEQQGMPEPAIKPAAVAQEMPFTDFRHIEKAHPTQLFGSMSESPVEPPSTPSRPIEPKPARRGASPAATRSTASYSKEADRTPPPAGSVLQPIDPVAEAMRAPSPAGDDLPYSVAAKLGTEKKDARSYRGLVICTLLVLCIVLCIASLDLFFTRYHLAGTPEISQEISAPHPASRPPATQQLPQFIPQVAPDAPYGASHPGWERYQADALEYLVYREKGKLRAIQVLSEARGAITLPFFKTCIRVSTGHEQFGIKKTEVRSGLQVITGTLQNGGELFVYREIPDGEIRGFVLSFPVDGQAPAVDAKVTTR